MIYDHRTYTCRPGTLPLQLKLYEEYGRACQTKHLGMPVIYAAVETGDVNTYVHVWAYENAGDRERKRAAMKADPDWITFLSKAAEAGYLVSQTNKILTPVPFFRALGDPS